MGRGHDARARTPRASLHNLSRSPAKAETTLAETTLANHLANGASSLRARVGHGKRISSRAPAKTPSAGPFVSRSLFVLRPVSR